MKYPLAVKRLARLCLFLSVLIILPMFSVILLQIGCRNEPPTAQSENAKFVHSMKGWDLYGWRESEADNFTLIAGTDRMKTIEEITSDGNVEYDGNWFKVKVTSVDSIKAVLTNLPDGELVHWVGAPPGFSELPDDLINEIKNYCEGLEISIDGFSSAE
jgi:hypothetical protein